MSEDATPVTHHSSLSTHYSSLEEVEVDVGAVGADDRLEQAQGVDGVVEVGGLDGGVGVAAGDVDLAGGDALADEVDGGDVGIALGEEGGLDGDLLAGGGVEEEALEGGVHDVAPPAAAADQGDDRTLADVDRQLLGEVDVGRAGGGEGVDDDEIGR